MGKEILEPRVAGTTSLGQKGERIKSLESTAGGTRRFRPVTGESMVFRGWLLVSSWIWISYQGHFCFSVQGSWGTGGPRGQLYNLLSVCGRLEEMTVSNHFVCMCGRRGKLGLAFGVALNTPWSLGPVSQPHRAANPWHRGQLHTCPWSP